MTLYCPSCLREYATIARLKAHFRRNHISEFCPICGAKARNLAVHARNRYWYSGCEEHAVLWYLLYGNRSRVREHYEVYEIVVDRLSRRETWRVQQVKIPEGSTRGWTREQMEFLVQNYRHMTIYELSVNLGKNPGSVLKRLEVLGLR